MSHTTRINYGTLFREMGLNSKQISALQDATAKAVDYCEFIDGVRAGIKHLQEADDLQDGAADAYIAFSIVYWDLYNSATFKVLHSMAHDTGAAKPGKDASKQTMAPQKQSPEHVQVLRIDVKDGIGEFKDKVGRIYFVADKKVYASWDRAVVRSEDGELNVELEIVDKF